MKKPFSLLAFLFSLIPASAALAEPYVGMAKPWELGLQPAATPVMEKLEGIHNNFLLPLIIVISIFVLLLLIFICLRFHHKRNPVPSKVAHNTKLEIAWTVIPVIILVAIAIPSLRIHYYMERNITPDLTVKVTGYQWYWHYDYPDNGGFGFDSYILKGKDLKPGDIRQLAVDNALVVPVDSKVRVLITGADVIHSWSVPSFGVKKDAVPGRLNETWFEANKIGTFYGQCSQLCGVGHGFMPIAVKVVSKEDFASWLKDQQKKAGIAPAAPATVLPLAKPQNLLVTPNATPVQKQEKAHSKATGQGKPVQQETPPQGRKAQPALSTPAQPTNNEGR